MSEVLDTIDDSLQEVEEQLLQEFDRIQNTLSDARFQPIDPGVKNALASVVADLKRRLEQTGDRSNLQLMTEKHEILLARMAVLRQLLDAKVPTAFMHEAHREVTSNRRKLEAEVTAQRDRDESLTNADDNPESEKRGFMGRLKGMFSGTKQTEKAVSRNRIQITEEEQKAHEPVSVYLDNGIYSASRELAALANVFSLPAQDQEKLQDSHEKKMRAVISGKAQFESRDLSAEPEQAVDKPGGIAQSPDEIRRKLAERGNAGSAGASSFQAKDLSAAAPPPTPKGAIAQTPDEIRRKLAERRGQDAGKASFSSKDIEHAEPVAQPTKAAAPKKKSATEIAAERKAELEAEKAKQPTTGKASFISKDIEPEVPQEAPRRRPAANKPADEKAPEPPRSGKAVFESRDLSNPPPGEKR